MLATAIFPRFSVTIYIGLPRYGLNNLNIGPLINDHGFMVVKKKRKKREAGRTSEQVKLTSLSSFIKARQRDLGINTKLVLNLANLKLFVYLCCQTH